MKSFPAAPLVLLLLILSVHPGTATRGSDVAKYCCLRFSTKILPWKLVRSYEFTRSSCPQQAVMFTTKKGLRVCAEPEKKWVQTYISVLKAQQQL